ncbi:glycoside hydrolase family protein [Saccharicrinis sp. GN24d3]|uniref:glycoside hydrolase family protein n=1 Tax=Saccharicrinis sp. GN24d3 TaxID=3458416 RepID=UPI004036CD5D
MKLTTIFILFSSITILFSCGRASSSSQRNNEEISDYKKLKFATLPTCAVDSFSNHSKTELILVEPDYYVWGLSVVKWNGAYHAYYSRWNKKYTFNGWMTYSEIAHAVSSKPEGPFEFVNVVLHNKKTTGWDINNAHNPYAIVADGKICLYYISNNIRELFKEGNNKASYPDSIWFKENRTQIRNSQCIGVAMAENPSGPFVRSRKPVVKPDNSKFKNIAVNPAVIYRNNQFTMIMKGDDMKYDKWFRIQLVGNADNPEGPFDFKQKPVYDEAQTEDACIWYDEILNKYYMVCHVIGKSELALFNSENGVDWQPDERKIFMKKEFTLSDATIWKPKRVERPFVLTNEKGQPIMLYVAVADKDVSGNIAIPVSYELGK